LKSVEGEIVVNSDGFQNRKKRVVINYADHHRKSISHKSSGASGNLVITPIVTTSDENYSHSSSILNQNQVISPLNT
jgi:hypothetical protein